MKNINQVDKYSPKDWKFLYRFWYPVLLFSLLSFTNLVEAQSHSTVNKTTTTTEVLSWDFLSQLDKKLWVKLPQWYELKVRNMLDNNAVLKNEYNRKFTQDFIIWEMKKNWWISKQNQLLFIRSAIYLGMEEKELYDGEDWDEKRLDEYEIAVDFVENCGNMYMEKLQKNIVQNANNLKQNTQEIISQIMSTDSAWLREMIRFYDLYKKDPNSVKPGELAQAKNFATNIISSCKEYWIDYKKLLPADIRKFYGIE